MSCNTAGECGRLGTYDHDVGVDECLVQVGLPVVDNIFPRPFRTQSKVRDSGRPLVYPTVEVVEDHVAQVLVCPPEKARRFSVTQESAEQFCRKPYKAVFVDCIFCPSGYEDAKPRSTEVFSGYRCLSRSVP